MSNLLTVRNIGIAAGVAVGFGAFFKAIDLISRTSNEQLAHRMITAFDHDGSGAIDYGATAKTLLDDERFAGYVRYQGGPFQMYNDTWVGGPATSASENAAFGGKQFPRIDTNNDGKVAYEEALAGYQALDTNRDGFLGGFLNFEKRIELPYVAPKVLDYRAPDDMHGITNF